MMIKQQALRQVLAECGSVCIGYSGGVDSAFLAVTALDTLGAAHILAVTGRSASYPDVQWQTARAVAAQYGVPHLEINTEELKDGNYTANPSNRCYYCKNELWTKLARVARDRRLNVLLDGSNADDRNDHRPGAVAAREHAVKSPLQEVGLTKAEIRELSRARGLTTWDAPSAPCLSSRVAYGISISPEVLRKIEAAEQVVRQHGIREFRVRYHGKVARLEVAPAEFDTAIERAALLNAQLRALGFARVLLDVEGYRQGSLNEKLVHVRNVAEMTSAVRLADQFKDIAVLDAPVAGVRELLGEVPSIRNAGFRFATVDLAR